MINEAKKPKMVKVYKITNTRSSWDGRDREYSHTGTLEELIKCYSYTLEKGYSWQNERGNHKINKNPKTIETLCKNLQWAADNAASNGYSGDYYTCELVGEQAIDEVSENKNNKGISKKALYESIMKKAKKLNENYADGWNEDDLYDLMSILSYICEIQYEIKNCRRGVYTNAQTYTELGKYIQRLGDQLSNIGSDISRMTEPEYDEDNDF